MYTCIGSKAVSPIHFICICKSVLASKLGIVKYQLEATDEEGDTIKFKLNDKEYGLGEASLSESGL